MTTPLGISNGNSQHAQLKREYMEPRPTLRQIVERPVTRTELETLAKYFAAKYDVALFHHNDFAIRTQEANLIALTEYAEVML
jgi:hypothetical protein